MADPTQIKTPSDLIAALKEPVPALTGSTSRSSIRSHAKPARREVYRVWDNGSYHITYGGFSPISLEILQEALTRKLIEPAAPELIDDLWRLCGSEQ